MSVTNWSLAEYRQGSAYRFLRVPDRPSEALQEVLLGYQRRFLLSLEEQCFRFFLTEEVAKQQGLGLTEPPLDLP